MKQKCLAVVFLSLFISILHCQPSIPGGASPQSVTIDFSIATSQTFINPPYVSGVINDPTDPAATIGVRLDVKENSNPILASDYTVTVTSSSSSVVAVANVIITKYDGYAVVKITPSGVGYSDVKLKLTKGSSTDNITIKYAASAASATPTSTTFHTSMSDASAAIALDSNYMVIGDDEINTLFVYDRKKSGLPVASFDYQNLLGLTDGSTGNYKEIDLEAGVRSINYPGRVYWMSSLGTAGSSSVVKANINRIFATNISGTGATTSISTVGYYNNIRSTLISWGDSKGYSFTSSAASGHDSKTIDGFNIEGMCFGPDNTSLYIAFRAPLLPISARAKALIAPVLNFETWFNSGSPTGNPTIGNPIELNLGGRGIRDIIRLSNGVYIIIAGNYAATPLTGAVFKWTGNASDAPVLIPDFNIVNLNAETVLEITENNVIAQNKLQIISDNGSFDFYNDGTEAKDLSQNNFKKFRNDVFIASTNVLPTTLIYFNAETINGKNYINCKINQANAKTIELEKSENDNRYNLFKTLNNVDNEFHLAVNAPEKGNDYYRLKITTQSGKTEYSNIIIIKNLETSFDFVVSPNPIASDFYIKTNSLEKKTVLIYNELGESLFKKEFSSKDLLIKNNFKKSGHYFIKVICIDKELIKNVFITNQ